MEKEHKMQVFNFENKKVRTIEKDGEMWFVAKDVAEILGYTWKGISGTLPHVPDEWKGGHPVQTPSGVQEMVIISEQGLYFFLGRSDKPAALPFQKFVAGDVIPQIRKTGEYRKPLTEIEIARNYLKALEEKEELKIALNMSLQYFTVAKYNKTFKMGWDMKKCQRLGKYLSAFCKANSFETRECETNDERVGLVKSYSLSAWESFLKGE
jgi:prophage antirepressor-like protein